MKLINQINELKEAGVITPETALDINNYYESKQGESSSRIMVVFSVLGSLLVGLGLILLFAHNWDLMGKTSKTIIAIAPLLITQVIGGYVILKKSESLGWREGIGSLIFICIGLSISLVGQIYNISGDLPEFIRTWMLLALPLLFLLRSSIVSFLITGGITWYVLIEKTFFRIFSIRYWDNYQFEFEELIPIGIFLSIMMMIIGFFQNLFKKEPDSNYITIASWIIPSALAIGLMAFENRNDEVLFLSYFMLFTLFIWFGKSNQWISRPILRNGFKFFGPLGALFMLFIASFEDLNDDLMDFDFDQFGLEWFSLIVILIPFVILLFKERTHFKTLAQDPLNVAFASVIPLFLFSPSSILTTIIINGLILVVGLHKTIGGLKKNLLGKLNLGLLIITVLVICRFFDRDMSFIVKGIIFLSLGSGFLMSNLWILKKKKNETKQ